MPDLPATENQFQLPAESRAEIPPSRVRYRILALLCALSMITYLDRACLGVAAPSLMTELSLSSEAELKWAFAAFAIAYALFEIPSGWLGDTLGPRGTLLRIVMWWSCCTALTAIVGLRIGTAVAGLGTLVVLRFLFGAGEAGAYPNITRGLHNWFPIRQRATAQGFIWMSGRLVGGLTPLFFMVLVTGTEWTQPLTTWRGSFVLLGLLGCAWCAIFALMFCNRPAEHPRVNAAELAQIEAGQPPPADLPKQVPWRGLFQNKSLWWLCGMYFCLNWGWSFHLTYLPSYLPYRFKLNPQSVQGALYKGGPLWLGAIGCLIGGLVVDRWLQRLTNPDRVRLRLCATCQVLAGLCWLAAIYATNVHAFVLAVSLAAFFNDLTMPSAWAVCQSIGGQYAGMAAAAMNTIGTLGSAVAIWATGIFVEHSLASQAATLGVAPEQLSASEKQVAALAGYDYGLLTYAAAYLLAAVCWRWIDPQSTVLLSGKTNLQSATT